MSDQTRNRLSRRALAVQPIFFFGRSLQFSLLYCAGLPTSQPVVRNCAREAFRGSAVFSDCAQDIFRTPAGILASISSVTFTSELNQSVSDGKKMENDSFWRRILTSNERVERFFLDNLGLVCLNYEFGETRLAAALYERRLFLKSTKYRRSQTAATAYSSLREPFLASVNPPGFGCSSSTQARSRLGIRCSRLP